MSHISCFTNSYGRFGPEAAFEWLPRAGIKYVELAIKNHGVPSFFKETPLLTDGSTPDDIAHAQSLLGESGLQLSSCNITAGNVIDPAVVDRTIHKLDIAATLGVDRVVSGAGAANTPDEKELLWRNLRQIGDAAEARGIIYCCETHPGACQNADRMLETMQSVDHPNVRLNFDTGNLFYYNRDVDLQQSLWEVAGYVLHVHLKDTPGGYEQWHFDEIGTGIVDFVMVRTVLDNAGYAGPFSLELEGIQGEPDLTVEQHHERVVRSVAQLRKFGFDV